MSLMRHFFSSTSFVIVSLVILGGINYFAISEILKAIQQRTLKRLLWRKMPPFQELTLGIFATLLASYSIPTISPKKFTDFWQHTLVRVRLGLLYFYTVNVANTVET